MVARRHLRRDHPLTRYAIDTNLLVYAEKIERSAADRPKIEESKRLFGILRTAGSPIVLSVQVLAELHYVLVRKAGLAPADASAVIGAWRAIAEVVGVDEDVLGRALDLAAKHNLQIYDSIILASVVGQADLLLTEDLQDGFAWGGVTVRNPFIAPLPLP